MRVWFAVMAIVLTACTGKNASQPGAQSPERQSEAEMDLAADFLKKGNQRTALDHAQKAVTLNDENEKAHYLVAAILISFCSTARGFTAPDCKLSEAEKSARAALKVNPEFRDAKNMLGQILINQKKYKEAIATLEPLTRDAAYIHPHFAWGNLGWAQLQDGQVDLSIASLRNAVSAESRFCVGHYRLGVAYEKKGELGPAEQSLTNAVTADPLCGELQDAWEARARVRMKLGKASEARQDYEKCSDISKETDTGKICVRELAKLGPGAGGAPASVATVVGRAAAGTAP
jgi:Tfp pilus assembly protein PilF